ncbi:CatB-related O-acetyltransferase [Leeuwenhoekiella sp. H156]|uniref:CatB-related O-acetyltransferase n=1 Tax=Leeuwenhoekiella sp. H156 TaxID=3450128 RepID=UPI003FA4BD7E
MIFDVIKFILSPFYRHFCRVNEFIKLKRKFPSLKLKGICNIYQSQFGKNVCLYNCDISNCKIDDFSYIAKSSILNNTQVGKFCSIGPNVKSGMGMHPINWISTHPIFYSTNNLTGKINNNKNYFKEYEKIKIGNDVWIGADVIIMDGVTIGDGSIIGAGSIVTKNIPDYSIAVGSPAKVKKMRFENDKIELLKATKWWDYPFKKIESHHIQFKDIRNIEKLKVNLERV